MTLEQSLEACDLAMAFRQWIYLSSRKFDRTDVIWIGAQHLIPKLLEVNFGIFELLSKRVEMYKLLLTP